ncbi:uncharacterized protein ALTATR162_LOCUS7407 [Alternaria atra]|uniref:Uncharacterized protein n=1 Tax=Alternaria atra TaxID=119953 RepID=A0A8J2I5J6_9PLEO|nr:uncharacterized protein ALTATR162_LOCUS7407 [Alternaria atra]CAG5171989.1 unnamed protein product [Alternaria atra]
MAAPFKAKHHEMGASRSQASQSSADPEEDLPSARLRPLRRSAANAASPIRKHARIDLGYVSDIAEAYDSHDADELDGEGVEYAPFDTQMQYGQMDEIPSEIPDCQNIGILNDPEPEYNGHYAHLASHIETVRFSPLVNAACIAEHESGSKCGSVFVEQARDYWTELFHMSLCSMPERVVKELTSGNLKQAHLTALRSAQSHTRAYTYDP